MYLVRALLNNKSYFPAVLSANYWVVDVEYLLCSPSGKVCFWSVAHENPNASTFCCSKKEPFNR